MSKFQDKLVADGYCDQRGAGFCATATKLPGGEYGIVCLCVNGGMLNLYAVDLKSNLGQQLYAVELKQVSNLKIKAGILSQVLRFEYQGGTFAFTNFMGVNPALKVIEEEAGR